MIFLNEPEAGGQTFFPNAKVRVTPRTGNLLMWNNLDQYGEPNTYSLHTGCRSRPGSNMSSPNGIASAPGLVRRPRGEADRRLTET